VATVTLDFPRSILAEYTLRTLRRVGWILDINDTRPVVHPYFTLQVYISHLDSRQTIPDETVGAAG
jgi:hypothetical protein